MFNRQKGFFKKEKKQYGIMKTKNKKQKENSMSTH
jgi:hypothetical protein